MASKKPKPRSALSTAVRAARRAMLFNQVEAGAAIGVSAVTISRWESGHFAPDDRARSGLARWASSLASPHREAILTAMGVMAAPAPIAPIAPSVAAAPTARADSRKAIDAAVLAMADALDVGPRSLRAALVTLLTDVEAAGAALPELRDSLTRAKGKRPA